MPSSTYTMSISWASMALGCRQRSSRSSGCRAMGWRRRQPWGRSTSGRPRTAEGRRAHLRARTHCSHCQQQTGAGLLLCAPASAFPYAPSAQPWPLRACMFYICWHACAHNSIDARYVLRTPAGNQGTARGASDWVDALCALLLLHSLPSSALWGIGWLLLQLLGAQKSGQWPWRPLPEATTVQIGPQ